MSDEVIVQVVKPNDRPYFRLRWIDPITGKVKTQSAKTTKKREAREKAVALQNELREGTHISPKRVTWAQFRDWYENNHLASLADNSGVKALTVLDRFEKVVNPRHVASINAQHLQYFQTSLRTANLQEATIDGYLAYIHSALQWAKSQGLIKSVPQVIRPKRAKGSKRRARGITGEEFDRMIEKVPEVVGDWIAEDWRFLLRGLWWSGLRLQELLNLTWDDARKPMVDTSGEYPRILMPAAYEKSHTNRTMIAAPEFAELLLSVPEEKRRGYVFQPTPIREVGRNRLSNGQAGTTIRKIGKAAGIKVHEGTRLGQPYVKFATAHDLRRSFAKRWSKRIMPPELTEVMRHKSITTTMSYYVDQNVDEISERMRATLSEEKSEQKSSTLSSSEPETGIQPDETGTGNTLKQAK